VDRYDLESMAGMLATGIAITLNLAFLQADAHWGAMRGQLVLVPIGAGLLIGLSGLVSHIRRHGRDMVIVDRIFSGALVYLALSVGCTALFQPRIP
jgi:hypothetical protein